MPPESGTLWGRSAAPLGAAESSAGVVLDGGLGAGGVSVGAVPVGVAGAAGAGGVVVVVVVVVGRAGWARRDGRGGGRQFSALRGDLGDGLWIDGLRGRCGCTDGVGGGECGCADGRGGGRGWGGRLGDLGECAVVAEVQGRRRGGGGTRRR